MSEEDFVDDQGNWSPSGQMESRGNDRLPSRFFLVYLGETRQMTTSILLSDTAHYAARNNDIKLNTNGADTDAAFYITVYATKK